MEMKKKPTTTISMKTLWLVLGLMVLVVTAEFGKAECRALRSTAKNAGNGGCEEADDDGKMVGMTSLAAVSSNNSSSNRPLARSLAFRLASGPSKKGPGH